MGVEFEDGGKMGRKVLPVVGARVEVEFVRDFAGGENFVERGGSAIEAEIVFGAAIKIDFEA